MGFFDDDDEEDVMYVESSTDCFKSPLYKRENDWFDNFLEVTFNPIVIFVSFVIFVSLAIAFGG